MKTSLATLISVVILFFSCKKDNEDTSKDTLAKVQGHWQVDSIVTNAYFNGTYTRDNHIGTGEDYVDFTTDGFMNTHFNGVNNKSSYEIRSDSVIVIGGDSGKIKQLTDNNFVIYTNAQAGAIGYIETTYYLKK